MENSNILTFLEDYCPDRAPTIKMSEWELGVLAGQRQLIEQLKIKLKVEEIETNDK